MVFFEGIPDEVDTPRDENGFRTFEHRNSAGGVAVVKSKGNCLEITAAPGWRIRTNATSELGQRIVYVWLDLDRPASSEGG